MASRIAGITVEIGGDTTGLQNSLKSVNSAIKTTQSSLKDVTKLLKLDSSNTDLLAQKQKLLKDAIGQTSEKLNALKTAQEQAKVQLESGNLGQDKYDALQREIIETEQELKRLQEQAIESNATLAKIEQVGEKLQNVGNAKGTVSYSYASCSSKNTLTTATYYKKTTETSWTNANKTFTSGTAFTFGGSLTTEASYDIKYTLTDAFGTISITDTLSTASVVMDFMQGGTGVAVGKVAETVNCFEVSDKWDMKVYGMLLEKYIAGCISDGIAFCTCDTAADEAAKVAACSDFKLKTGAMAAVKFTNTNTTSQPSINIGGTGAKYIVSYGNYAPTTYMWKPGQTVFLIFDGTYYVAVNANYATTTYYGVTKLTSSTSSTSTTLAATASAVKAAYDRNSWDSITLDTALAIASGGTGATTAAAARTNLGITIKSLYSGTLTTGSTTFTRNDYSFYIIVGVCATGSSRCCMPEKVYLNPEIKVEVTNVSKETEAKAS